VSERYRWRFCLEREDEEVYYLGPAGLEESLMEGEVFEGTWEEASAEGQRRTAAFEAGHPGFVTCLDRMTLDRLGRAGPA
jgi:hypothetical protein